MRCSSRGGEIARDSVLDEERSCEYYLVVQLHPDQRTATAKTWRNSLVAMIEPVESRLYFREEFCLSVAEKAELYDFWEFFWPVALEIPRPVLMPRP